MDYETFTTLALTELERIVPRFECLEGQSFHVVNKSDNLLGVYSIWCSKNDDDYCGYYLGYFEEIEELKTDIDFLLDFIPEKIMGADVWLRAYFTKARWERRYS